MRAGFGTGVITPDLPVVLAGFGDRKGLVHEVRHELEAHALVLEEGNVTVCLLVLDLLLLGPDFAAPIRAAVGSALGIPPERVLTSCTHTHAGPAATAFAKRAGWPVPEGYLDIVLAGSVTAATSAVLETCTASFARAPLPEGLSLNRRGLPYDPAYSVLELTRPNGTRVGAVANVGIHPVALGVTARAVSGDWVSSFRPAASARAGAPVILLPGALGDVNPTRDPHTEPEPAGNWETAHALGLEVADCTDALLGKGSEAGPGLTAVVRQLRPRAGLTLAALLAGVAGRRVDVELHEWALGDVMLASIPGEGFHALGRAVERRHGDRALLAGLSPVWQGYLPEPFSHGYEEKMSYGRRFVRRVTGELTR
ncbi:MAG: hypothetical protein ABR549_03070 [Mycobacteriales bacterium]